MVAERRQRVEQLLHAALERKRSERRAYLERECAGDRELLDEAWARLALELASPGRLGSEAADPSARSASPPLPASDEPTQDLSDSRIGKLIAHYTILESIGRGGMGQVYLALDASLDRKVALKFLSDELNHNPIARRRFQREARSAAALDHPYICKVYEVGEHEGRDYIAMEYVDGRDLEHMLAEAPPPLGEALRIAGEIVEALDKAHHNGIVHRDLKPSNIMLTAESHVKVMDFGLAKRSLDEPSDGEDATLSVLTGHGAVLGTPAYMSPEQHRGRVADRRSDIFSLGIILYQLLTGVHPFLRKSPADTASAILGETPPPLSHYSTDIPEQLQTIVDGMLEKDLEQRTSSVATIGEQLDACRELVVSGSGSRPSSGLRAPAPPWHKRTSRLLSIVGAAVVLATLLLGLDVAGLRARLFGADTPAPIRSLAVLPLHNLSGDPEQEYFADGITEELITNLSQVASLKVISRTSAMHYKGSDKPLPEIARELGVQAVVEGAAVRFGQRVRVTARLIDAATDQPLWSDSFERDLRDVLYLQSEVSRAIVDEIRLELTPSETRRLAARRQVDPQAYAAYLKGMHYGDIGFIPEHRQCVEHFQEAIAREPEWADAYTALAGCYASLPWHLPPREVYPLAREAAQKALALDPENSKAHSVLATVSLMFDWNIEAAERHMRRARELGGSDYRLGHGLYLFTGRFEDAIRVAQANLERDPVSHGANRNLSYVYILSRRYEDAVVQARETLKLAPGSVLARFDAAWALALQGKREEALAELDKGAVPWVQALVLAALGERERAVQLADQIEEEGIPGIPVDPSFFAWLYGPLGDADRTLYWLEESYEYRSAIMGQLKVHPAFDRVRDDPRFQELLRRMGFDKA